MERNDDTKKEEIFKTYGEADLEEEIICALRKINILKKMNLKEKE
jgi:hypothetical protein